jgi:glycosyltransferase involved in cell wall biosynthesis
MVCGTLGRKFFEQFVKPSRLVTYIVPYEPDYRQIQEFPDHQVARVAQEFNLPPERRRIVYSGRLAPVKRVDLLIDAFTHLADERPDWDLVLVGDGPLRTQLQQRVPARLTDRVRWVGFMKDQAQVTAIYHNCDLLCLPSQYEPWALVINEAAAAGLAIVTSDIVGASAELVRDGLNGKTFPSKNLDALIDALRSATAEDQIDRLKAGSLKSLADWRSRGDPIRGLSQALSSVPGTSSDVR